MFQIKHRFNGSVMFECELPADVVARISHAIDVDTSNGCWLWRFGLTHGHARMAINGRRVYVHRLMLEAATGSTLSDEQMACHHCGVSRCINPAHLYAGTAIDNARDAVRHGHTTKGRPLSPEHRANVSIALMGRARAAEQAQA